MDLNDWSIMVLALEYKIGCSVDYKREADSCQGELLDVKKDKPVDNCAISILTGRAKPRLSVMPDKLSNSSLNNDSQRHRLYRAESLPQGHSDFS